MWKKLENHINMDNETIEKLREYKQLVAEGILTQEEFENEKRQLLSNKVTLPSNDQPNSAVTEMPQQQSRPLRTIHVPLLQRKIVMDQSTPDGVVKKCENLITTGKIYLFIGIALDLIFVYYLFSKGFWAILGAMFWAATPGTFLIILGASALHDYTGLRDKFVGLTQREFEYVQEVIRTKRANEKEAIITFAEEFEKSYQQQTGRNVWYDTGEYVDRKLFGND